MVHPARKKITGGQQPDSGIARGTGARRQRDGERGADGGDEPALRFKVRVRPLLRPHRQPRRQCHAPLTFIERKQFPGLQSQGRRDVQQVQRARAR